MTRRIAVLFAAAAAVLALAGCGAQDSDSRMVAAVYRGPAACDGCPEAVASLLEESGLFTVEYLGPAEERDVTVGSLSDVDLYAQPGGFDDVALAMDQLGPAAAEAIVDWVNGGGRYVGFCMGAYLAGSDPGMGLLSPGDTDGYAGTAGAEVSDSGETVIPVDWGEERRFQYAQEPALIIESGVAGERVLSRYTTGAANALVRPAGDGAVAVVGTHPEAEQDWFTPELAELDIDGSDRAQALQLVDALMAVG